MRVRRHLEYLFWGALFGWILSRSGATRFDFIHKMFLMEEFRLYGMISSAIATALPGFWLMKAFRRRRAGLARLHFPSRRFTKGTLPGAALFGAGWALTGTCPGPAIVQVGEGHFMALFTVAGIFLGNWLYGWIHERYFDWSLDFCS